MSQASSTDATAVTAPRVVVVGSINADLVMRVPRLPKPGETLTGEDLLSANGGKGANQAVAAARQGGRVAMIGCVGNDPFGRTLRQALETERIDTAGVRVVAETSSGVAVIFLDADGQNSILLSPGANARLGVDHVDSMEETIAAADVALFQMEVPTVAVRRAMEIARAAKVSVILNPAPATTEALGLVSLADVVIPNESEAALLTGTDVCDLQSAEVAAAALRDRGPSIVLLTLGRDGVVIATQDGARHFPAFEVSAVDTTAAGDTFVGTFAVAWASGEPLDRAVPRAQAAAALAVTGMGAQPSIPDAEKTLEFLQDPRRADRADRSLDANRKT